MKGIFTAALLVVLGLGLSMSQAIAQQQSNPQAPADDLRARLEQQESQIQQLQSQLSNLQQGPVTSQTAYAPSGGTATVPAAGGAPCPGAVVESDTSIKTRFFNGEGVMFETPNKDFTMHLGGWFQWDNVWWNQNDRLSVAPAAQTSQGVAANGIGPLQDGDYWRRIRIVMEGTFFETCEYRWNYAPEANVYNTIGLDEFWVGINKIPVIGTVRVGHVKNPMGLEGDMTSSSRCMTFMERSSYSEAIELNQNFVTGVWLGNTYLDDDRGTWSCAAFRPSDTGNSGDFFGNGQSGAQGRLTALPLYEDEGRHLMHLGISGGWRDGQAVSPGGPHLVELRARPELRDDDPAGSGPPPAGAIPNYFLPNSNKNRMIDTGNITCEQEFLLGTELLYIRGPFSFQAEYGWNFLNNAQVTIPAVKPVANYVFNGGYMQVAYTLTGENRAYDKRSGGLSRYYFGPAGPYERAFIVRDENGNICSGHGAWEIACRYSYTNLNDGSGASFVNGGIMQGVSLGLNWYLNTNLTVNTEWVYNDRYDLPVTGVNGGTTAFNGYTSGFGTRVQLSF
ncbi:MAG: porin [Thermoguttaceae bacterium]|jgi:phosphate-selective porin OprO/OprP